MALELKIDNISFAYNGLKVLVDINVNFFNSQMVSLVGPNGSGKTTLLKCINKLLTPSSGSIYINDKNILQLSGKQLSRIVGYVPQSENQVFPYTVLETVMMGRKPHINWVITKKDISIVSEILKKIDIEHLGERFFDELSGGEKQKVSIARALVQKPDILLLDEPTSNLDICHQLEVMELLKDFSKDDNILIIMAMHDLNLSARYSEKIIMLKSKKIFASGSPENVINSENILRTYNIESLVKKSGDGYPVIQHISSVRKEMK